MKHVHRAGWPPTKKGRHLGWRWNQRFGRWWVWIGPYPAIVTIGE